MQHVHDDLATRLELFLESLPEDAGFSYGVRERLTLNELFIKLIESNKFPFDVSELKTLISPIICGSAAQQHRFGDLFDQTFEPSPSAPSPPPPPEVSKWIIPGTIVAILCAAAITTLIFVGNRPKPTLQTHKSVINTPPAPVSSGQLFGTVVSQSKRPIAGAEIWIPGQRQTTPSDGSFRFSLSDSNPPIPVLLYHANYGSQLGSVTTWDGKSPITLTLNGGAPDPAAMTLENTVLGPSFSGSLWAAEIRGDGKYIAIGAGAVVLLWSAETGQKIAACNGHSEADSLSFGPTALLVARGAHLHKNAGRDFQTRV